MVSQNSNTSNVSQRPAAPITRLTPAEKAKQRRVLRALARHRAKAAVQKSFQKKDAQAAQEQAIADIFKNSAGLSHEQIVERVQQILGEGNEPEPRRGRQGFKGVFENSNHAYPMYMSDAPRGKGKITTGGYDAEKCSRVVAAHDRAEKGRRVKPQGVGSELVESARIIKTPKFDVKLNENFKLSREQQKFERLAKRNKANFERELQMEERRLSREFLARLEAGPIRNPTAQVVENKESGTQSTIIEKDRTPLKAAD